MRIIKFCFSLSLILLLGFWGLVYAKGLSVSPSEYNWKDVTIGSKARCPAAIMIKNDSGESRSYVLRAVSPSELGSKPKKGFIGIPSEKWVSFDNKVVSIGPGQWKQIELFIEIPKEKQNFNRKWEFYLEVKEYTSKLEFFVLGCYSRFSVTTAKK